MANEFKCWQCGETVDADIHRSSECRNCNADLKVCVMCVFYNPSMSDHCDEPNAEYVNEIKRANFCDYFKVKANAHLGMTKPDHSAAQQELNALFGLNTDKTKEDD